MVFTYDITAQTLLPSQRMAVFSVLWQPLSDLKAKNISRRHLQAVTLSFAPHSAVQWEKNMSVQIWIFETPYHNLLVI